MKNHFKTLPSRGGTNIPRTSFKNINSFKKVTKIDIQINKSIAAAKFVRNGIIKRGRRTTKSILKRRQRRITNTRISRNLKRCSNKSKNVDSNIIIDSVHTTSCCNPKHESGDSANSLTNGFIAKRDITLINNNLNNNIIIQHKHFISPRSINRIATFNTRTLKSQWKKQELCAICEMKNISILLIQEHRIYFDNTNNDDPIRKMHIGKGWYFYYTSASPQDVGGIGIMLSPFAISTLDSVISINERIMQLQFSSNYESTTFKTSLFNIYSPTSASNKYIIEDLYDILHECCDKIPKGNLLIVGGDFNATILPKKNVYSASRSENRNSYYLQEFMSQIELTAINTLFQKPKRKLITFHGTKNRKVGLDHILISNKWSNFTLNCDIYSPLNISSDHAILYGDLKWKLSSTPKTISANVDWSSIKSDSN